MNSTPREIEATPPAAPHKLTKLDYLIIVLLVNLSGNSAFYVRYPDIILVATLAFFLIVLIERKKRLFTPGFVLIFLSFSAILLIQSAIFSFFPVVTILGFLVRMAIGYAAVRLVKDFPRAYVNVLFYTGILSLMFYLPDQLGQRVGFDVKAPFAMIRELVGQQGVNRYHILVHNFQINIHAGRNSSYFGEPGLFASHLLLAIMFLALVRDQFTPLAYRRRLVLLIVCLLTTFSTTGYSVLFLALLLHLRLKGATRAAAYGRLLFTGAFLLALSLAALKAYQLEFMGTKIEHQLELVLEQRGDWRNTRFGGIVFEWEYIKRRPILGWGLHSVTRYSLDPDLMEIGLGGGTAGFVTNFGFVGMGLLFRFSYFSPQQSSISLDSKSGFFDSMIEVLDIYIALILVAINFSAPSQLRDQCITEQIIRTINTDQLFTEKVFTNEVISLKAFSRF